MRIYVKGKKPRIDTKTITLSRDTPAFDETANQLATNLTNDPAASIKWAWNEPAKAKDLGFGSTITTDENRGVLSGTFTSATKGTNIKVSADNLGQSVQSNIKFIIRDPDPVITGDDAINVEAAVDSKGTNEARYEIGTAQKTGDTDIAWKIATKPADKRVKASLKAASDNMSCVVTVTVDKKTKDDITPTFTITATNKSTKAVATKEITINVTGYTEVEALPEEKTALPESETTEEEALAEEEELEQGEGTVTYGENRAADTLTEAERSALAEGGYIIAAILPEITADESGQYDLDAVSLDEAAPEGGELVWFAFPRNVESSDDDIIAEFYDEAGAEVFAVPEGRKVVPAPWLEAEVTYAPVIAVKAPAAGDAKTSLDGAEEGDKVTEQAVEEAAEKAAETPEASDEAEKVSEEAKHAE